MSEAADVLIAAYREHLSKEPPQDAGGHPSQHVHQQVGALWAEWERTRLAFRTIIGHRLVAEALDTEPSR